ncbi:MAG: type II toxin-antitoxin system RelE/ParE family toxin [Verrucomicrobiota bacterium]|nr:type II toxin-antitoxin system RelE/ParE family toxin [Verrucomicrobiota bacterium]
MLPLKFHPLVEADVEASAGWYSQQQLSLAERFLREVRECLDALPTNASLYAIRFADIRRVNLPVFQHGVFHFIADDAIVVLGILHGHRDSKAELQWRRKKYG